MNFLPQSAMGTASDLYQQALAMGVSPTLAAYLVGSAYQESAFKPDAVSDYVGGKPTSFGLMQVGSPSLGSGAVPDQFKNYIERFQKNAPDTWAAMNAASSPEGAYAAQHANPDWRMGTVGSRFGYARQLLGDSPTSGDYTSALTAPRAPVQEAPGFTQGSNPQGMSTFLDYAAELDKQKRYDQAGSAISSAFAGLGKQIQESGQEGMKQAMQIMQQKSPAAGYLHQLLFGGGGNQYPDYTSYFGG
jgi:hypothetical protein